MRAFRIQFKRGREVLLSFDCMAESSCAAVCQHIDLAPEGCYMKVEALHG